MAFSIISSAVFARYVSSFKEQRVTLSKSIKNITACVGVDHACLEQAYRFARIINHQQGFDLIGKASEHFNWNLNLSEIARIWTNGCIIRSKLMEDLVDTLKETDQILLNSNIVESMKNLRKDLATCIGVGMANNFPLLVFSSAMNYFSAFTNGNSSANMIQAQRDYFGGHGLELKSGEKTSLDWEGPTSQKPDSN